MRLACLLSIVLLATPVAAQNLITNGSFDSDLSAWAQITTNSTTWSSEDATLARFHSIRQAPPSSSGSALVRNSAPGGAVTYGLSQTFDIYLGGEYSLLVLSRLAEEYSDGTGAYVIVDWMKNDGSTAGDSVSYLQNGSGWQILSETVRAPDTATRARLRLQLSKPSAATRSVYYDEIRFVPVNYPNAPTQFANTSFTANTNNWGLKNVQAPVSASFQVRTAPSSWKQDDAAALPNSGSIAITATATTDAPIYHFGVAQTLSLEDSPRSTRYRVGLDAKTLQGVIATAQITLLFTDGEGEYLEARTAANVALDGGGQWRHVEQSTAPPPRGATGVDVWLTVLTTRSTPSSAVYFDNIVFRADTVQASFTWSPANLTTEVVAQFTDTSTGSPITWSWDFDGNGTPDSTLQHPTHVYTIPGTYNIRLTVSNTSGQNTTTRSLAVTAPPTCSLSCTTSVPSTGTAGTAVAFTASAQASNCSSAPGYAWSFGDGTTSNQQSPMKTYTSSGTFNWSLNVSTSGQTCTRNGSVTITSVPAPTANFTWAPSIIGTGMLVQFTDTSTGTPTQWDWDFDNNGSTDSTLQHPTHIYTTAGTYEVALTARNSSGSHTARRTLVVTGLGPEPLYRYEFTAASGAIVYSVPHAIGDSRTKEALGAIALDVTASVLMRIALGPSGAAIGTLDAIARILSYIDTVSDPVRITPLQRKIDAMETDITTSTVPNDRLIGGIIGLDFVRTGGTTERMSTPLKMQLYTTGDDIHRRGPTIDVLTLAELRSIDVPKDASGRPLRSYLIFTPKLLDPKTVNVTCLLCTSDIPVTLAATIGHSTVLGPGSYEQKAHFTIRTGAGGAENQPRDIPAGTTLHITPPPSTASRVLHLEFVPPSGANAHVAALGTACILDVRVHSTGVARVTSIPAEGIQSLNIGVPSPSTTIELSPSCAVRIALAYMDAPNTKRRAARHPSPSCAVTLSKAASDLTSPMQTVAVTINADTTCNWNVSTGVEWVQAMPTQGSGSAVIILRAMTNTSKAARETTVVVNGAAHRIAQAPDPTNDNLVVNGTFDQDVKFWAGPSLSWYTRDARGGGSSGSAVTRGMSQLIPLRGNGQYKFSADVFVPTGRAPFSSVHIGARTMTADGQTVRSNILATATKRDEWERLEATVSVFFDEVTAFVDLEAYGGGFDDTVYFDNVLVQPIP